MQTPEDVILISRGRTKILWQKKSAVTERKETSKPSGQRRWLLRRSKYLKEEPQMRKIIYLTGLLFMFVAFPVRTEAIDPVQPPETTLDAKKKSDISKEVACGCCKLCAAARKPVTPDKKGSPAANGCGDCCERCGKVERSPQETSPPEIIRKK
jgi:hypothetical protein